MKEILDTYVNNYNYKGGLMEIATAYCCSIFMRHIKGESILELGPAEGIMTDLLYSNYHDYTIVEGSAIFANILRQKYPTIKVNCCYFERFEPERKYDTIILGHILEHVDNPISVLMLCKKWLKEDGVILAAVPNSHSLHRQAAVKMGIMKKENELNNTDIGIGHKRVYNMEGLKADFQCAGFKILNTGGYWIKPLTNSQIESTWPAEVIKSYMELGEKYPEIAAEIYIVAAI